MHLRDTFADMSGLRYRLKAAGALLGVTDNTVRAYADNAGVEVIRASDVTPGAPPIRLFTPHVLFSIAQWRRRQGYVKTPARKGQVIAVDVIKGGTGKTTTAVELAIHLQLLGCRTLLIDLDVQANATQMMGYEPDLTPEEATQYGLSPKAIVTHTIANVMIPYLEARHRGQARQWDCEGAIKKPFGEDGPHLVPADTFIGDMEQAIATAKGQRELYLRQLLEAAREGRIPGFDLSSYDVIVLDCPPSVSFTSTSAVTAADYVVAPVRLDAFSLKGLVKLMREIEVVAETYPQVGTPKLVILPTHYVQQFSRIWRMQAQLQQHYADWLAPTVISASEDFPKWSSSYLPLSILRPTSHAAQEYRKFAEYMHSRLLTE